MKEGKNWSLVPKGTCGISLKKRVQGDTFITHCTASYKLFINQTSTKYPTNLPGSSFFLLFPILFSLLLFYFSLPVQLQLSAESVGVVHIRSTQSGQYLAMDTNGLLYGSVSGGSPGIRPGEGCRNLTAEQCKPQGNHQALFVLLAAASGSVLGGK